MSDTLNLVLWLIHFALLGNTYGRAAIRRWWNGDRSQGYEHGVPRGRKRWLAIATCVLPVYGWTWLVFAIRSQYRERQELAEAQVELAARERHDRDVTFWRERAQHGDMAEACAAVELLAMWRVPLEAPAAPSFEQQLREATLAPLGSHTTASTVAAGCTCRNCNRARYLIQRSRLPLSEAWLDIHREERP